MKNDAYLREEQRNLAEEVDVKCGTGCVGAGDHREPFTMQVITMERDIERKPVLPWLFFIGM